MIGATIVLPDSKEATMVLIYDRAPLDPRMERLSDAAQRAWYATVSLCNTVGRETVTIDEIDQRLAVYADRGHPIDTAAVISELVASDLAARLPDSQIKMLARLDLWAFDDEADPDFVFSLPGGD